MPRFIELTRQRLLIGLSLLACVGLVLGAVYLEARKRRGPVWDKYQKVQLGMTEEQVKGLLGSPDSVEGGGLSPSCLAWFEGDQTIAVIFDGDDKATEKCFRPGRTSAWVRDRVKTFP